MLIEHTKTLTNALQNHIETSKEQMNELKRQNEISVNELKKQSEESNAKSEKHFNELQGRFDQLMSLLIVKEQSGPSR